ncbi:hypothetical protein OPIT5_23805 [Opitutaceae bacterium TAV5]|nr:hypothetical protein OPIT5_23805 [Opitutaceae bacterium TAV5]
MHKKTINPNRRFSIGGKITFACLAATLLVSPAAAVLINNTEFSFVYDGSLIPTESTPAWTKNGTGTLTASTTDGILSMAASNTAYYSLNDPSIWQAGEGAGTTIEFSMKVVQHNAGAIRSAMAFVFSTGSRAYIVNFTETTVFFGNTVTPSLSYAIDTKADFNTYRLTLTPAGVVSLYINNSATPVITDYGGQANTSDQIYFGSGAAQVGGTVLWDYIAFTHTGAFAPIPEPGSVALVGGLVGFTVMLLRRKRNR